MVTGLVEATGEMCGERLLVASTGVFIEFTARDRHAWTSEGQRLGASSKLWMICYRSDTKQEQFNPQVSENSLKIIGRFKKMRMICLLSLEPILPLLFSFIHFYTLIH